MAAKSNAWLDAASRMLKVPKGPPLPHKEVLAILNRLRKFIDQLIVKVERDRAARDGKGKGKGRKRPARRKARAAG